MAGTEEKFGAKGGGGSGGGGSGGGRPGGGGGGMGGGGASGGQGGGGGGRPGGGGGGGGGGKVYHFPFLRGVAKSRRPFLLMRYFAAFLWSLPWIIPPLITYVRLRHSRSLDDESNDTPENPQLVTVIVPARNEAHNIGRCV